MRSPAADRTTDKTVGLDHEIVDLTRGVNAAATSSSPEQDRPRRLGDRFRATRVLRAGPGGETLRGIDTADGSEVVIRTVASPDPSAAARLEEELATLVGLEGTGLVLPIAAGRQGGVVYSVQPYVPGVTLEAHLGARAAPLEAADALTVGRGVLSALAEAHDHAVLHGDVRPSNVVVRAVPGRPGRLEAGWKGWTWLSWRACGPGTAGTGSSCRTWSGRS
ncbi:MAG TPA: protein kinase [Acidimicrobiales bacterium]|nr:protein kinase [Acidimicrobiales bacterium]